MLFRIHFHIPFPNRTLLIQWISPAPIHTVKCPVGTKVDTDNRNSVSDLHVVDHFKTRAVFFDLKRPLLAVRGAGMKKVVLPLGAERGARIERKSGGAVVVKTDWRSDVAWLIFLIRNAHVFVHPRIELVFSILPIRAPTGIHVLNDVDETLFLTGAIGVIVDSKNVAVLIKSDFLNIP